MVGCMDKGLARLDLSSLLPRPGGNATVLTKHGPELFRMLLPFNLPNISHLFLESQLWMLNLNAERGEDLL